MLAESAVQVLCGTESKVLSFLFTVPHVVFSQQCQVTQNCAGTMVHIRQD